ncbi:MAG: DUF72 domain-containing protein [Candidatus Helarchaeota archaeon]
MNKLYIGCGGWAYADFGDSPGTKLQNYAKLFNFVEVNSTFYNIPEDSLCEKWRSSVPPNFSFAVKCNRELSHIRLFKPNEKSYNLFRKMIKICRILKAIALVIQTPQSFLKKTDNLKNIGTFFRNIDCPVNLAWEVRGLEENPKMKSNLIQILSEYNISHSVDLSKNVPLYSSKIAYFRLFGSGVQNMWQFDDYEIQILNNKVQKIKKQSDVILSFHTMRMERDSARYQEYATNDKFIPATDSVGLESFMSVIKEYKKFPISKNEILENHGWKIVDITEKNRIRASNYLKNIPNKNYKTYQDIENEIAKLISPVKQKKLDQFR